jgi:hypothetical protein
MQLHQSANVTPIKYALALLSGAHNSLLMPFRVISDQGRRTLIELGVAGPAGPVAWCDFGRDLEAAKLGAPVRGEVCGIWLENCSGVRGSKVLLTLNEGYDTLGGYSSTNVGEIVDDISD